MYIDHFKESTVRTASTKCPLPLSFIFLSCLPCHDLPSSHCCSLSSSSLPLSSFTSFHTLCLSVSFSSPLHVLPVFFFTPVGHLFSFHGSDEFSVELQLERHQLPEFTPDAHQLRDARVPLAAWRW